MSVSIESVGASKYRNASEQEVVLCLSVPNHKLFSWSKRIKNKEDTVLNLLKSSVDAIQIADSATKLQERVRAKAYSIAGDIKRSGHRKRLSIESKSSLFDVHRDELVQVQDLEDTITKLNKDIQEYE